MAGHEAVLGNKKTARKGAEKTRLRPGPILWYFLCQHVKGVLNGIGK